MAAHIITALAQVAEQVIPATEGSDPVAWEQLDAALKLSSWTEDLDYEDWVDLDEIVTRKDPWDLYEWVEGVCVKYLARYAERGFPATREEWNGKG